MTVSSIAVRLILSALVAGALAVAGAGAAVPAPARNGLIAFVADRAPDSGGELFAVPSGGGPSRDVSKSLTPDSDPAVSPDGTRIAFFSARGGFTALYVSRSDGSRLRRVTGKLRRGESEDLLYGATIAWSPDGRTLAYDGVGRVHVVPSRGGRSKSISAGSGPSWSADGTKLAFTDARARRPFVVVATIGGHVLWSRAGRFPIWAPRGPRLAYIFGSRTIVTDPAGRRLGAIAGSLNSWSPNGQRIAVWRGTRSTLYVARWNGHEARGIADGVSSAWSPDSRRIAVSGRRGGAFGVWVADARTGHTRLIRGAGFVAGWSARGRILLFGDVPVNDAPRGLYVLRPAGGPARRIAHARAGSALSSAAFARGGRTVVYRSEHTGGNEIYAIRRDGKGLRALTRDGRDKSGPAWSAGGSEFAYGAADVVGRCHGCGYQIRTQRLGDAVADAVVGGRTAFGPTWSPDGTQVAYGELSGDEGAEIVVARLDGSSSASVADGTQPAWSPDGQLIAFASSAAGGLAVMRPDGSDVRRIATGIAPAWSPDGVWIAYARQSEIRAVHPDGSEDHLVLAARADAISWSPDGRFIAYSTGTTIYVVGSDGTDKTRLTNGRQPAWQPLPG